MIILNPNASKGRGEHRKAEIEDCFKAKGITPDFSVTRKSGDAVALARNAALSGYREVIAAGGDGTVNEVLNGIMKSGESVNMGIIPIGRGNDFAWIAGIPKQIDKAVGLITTSPAIPVDCGYLEGGNAPDGRYFFNGAGVGFEPSVTFQASSYRSLNGLPSYIAAFIYCLVHIPYPYHLELTIDGARLELDTQQVSMCNGRRMGSAFIMTPDALLDDGKLNVMYAKHPVGRWSVIKMVMSLLRGTVNRNPLLAFSDAKEVEIASIQDDLVVHVDGEEISRGCRHLQVKVCPDALKLHYASSAVSKKAR